MQFFLPEHYNTFIPPKPTRDDSEIREERLRVRDRFLILEEQIWPFIQRHNWDLHRHRQRVHYVSSDHFIFLPDGTPIVDNINSMWLHYGKSPEQLDFLRLIGGYDYKRYNDEEFYNAFYLHTRIQIFINLYVFRFWLLLATDKNYYDRSEFLRKLLVDENTEIFYNLIQSLLGKNFFYEIDDQRLYLEKGLEKKTLLKFVKKDRHGIYSGIVKEYTPNDILINEDNILNEIQTNLELLYPLYDFMACRINPNRR